MSFTGEYPVTVNDPEQAGFALEVAAELFGADRARALPDPIMGSEDFSRVLAEVPGAFVFLGACADDDPETAPTNHSARARFDDGVLPDAALLLAELARQRAGATRAAVRPAQVAPVGHRRSPARSTAAAITISKVTSKALLRTWSRPASRAGQGDPLDRRRRPARRR